MHVFLPPWFIFPWLGLSSELRRRWKPLGAAGLGFWDVMLIGREAAARGDAAPPAPADALVALEARVRRLRRRAVVAAAFAVFSALSFAIGVSAHAPAFIIPFVAFAVLAVVTGANAARDAAAARRAGVRATAALSGRWRDAVAAADPRPRAVVLDDEARRLVGDRVLAGPHGPAVREALEDRRAVRDTVAALAPADRALLPMGDVAPTLDGLVARVGELARRLDDVDRDATPGALDALDARIAALRQGAPGGAEREGTLALLERQRASLADLAERRAALADRMERARLALRNLRLDFLKLRHEGVGALAAGSATQEARALSRDLRHALEAAGEVRDA
jgi:hypothetical protein